MKTIPVVFFIFFVSSATWGQVSDSVATIRALDSLRGQYIAYVNSGRLNEAELLLQKSKSYAISKFSSNHITVARCEVFIASIYTQKQEYTQAENSFENAKKILKSLNQEDDFSYIVNFATLKTRKGDYELAEALFKKAEQILTSSPLNNPILPQLYVNFSVVYQETDRHEEAIAVLMKAKGMLESIHQDSSNFYANCLGNLGAVYSDVDSLEKAEYFTHAALSIRKKILRTIDFQYLSNISNLALIKLKKGNFSEAEGMLAKVAKELKDSVGIFNFRYSNIITNLGDVYLNTQHYQDAKINYLESLTIRDSLYGELHPDYLYTLNRLIWVNEKLEARNQIESIFTKAAKIESQLLAKASDYQNEAELGSAIANSSKERERHFSTIHRLKLSQVSEIMFNSNLFNKGFLLEKVTQLTKFANVANDSIRQILAMWKDKNRRLAKLREKTKAEQKGLEELEKEANELEKKLVKSSSAFGHDIKQIDWKQVRAQLKPNEVALEFFHFRYHNSKEWTDSVLYYALLLRPVDSIPQLIYLFEEKQLLALLRSPSNDPETHIDIIYNRPGLYNLIWKPMEHQLTGIQKIWYAADGLLHRIAFPALIRPKDGKRIVDVFDMQLLFNTRELVIGKEKLLSGSIKDAKLWGGIRYATDTLEMRKSLNGLDSIIKSERKFNKDVKLNVDTRRDIRGNTINDLVGSKKEVERISLLIQKLGIQTSILSGYEAIEESFKRLGEDKLAPNILHLATHGYFEEDPIRTKSDMDKPYKFIDNPMFRSWLAFAGVQQAYQNGKAPSEALDDGKLYAWDISNINLSNTKLVVLSACETALGDIRGSEGVYGLQRAFKIAGVQHIIMSLWKVSDKATSDFMEKFYSIWFSDSAMDVREAFHKAQIEMKKKYPNEPYYWAAFVMI